jgi:hypothetical protein
MLALPDFYKVFQVDCSASGMAIGVVLIQEEGMVSFLTAKFNETKHNYFVYDQ